MVTTENGYLEQFRNSLAEWKDERLMSQKDLWACAMFNLYIVNLADAQGFVYDGHSLKMGVPMCCLTVKATIEDIPYVVFNSGRDPMACIRIFVRKLEAEVLEWRPDQYRQ